MTHKVAWSELFRSKGLALEQGPCRKDVYEIFFHKASFRKACFFWYQHMDAFSTQPIYFLVQTAAEAPASYRRIDRGEPDPTTNTCGGL